MKKNTYLLRVLLQVSCVSLLTACVERPQPMPVMLGPHQIMVGVGDTIYGLGYRYGVSTQALIEANALTPPYVLIPGQVLLIPQHPGNAPSASPSAAPQLADGWGGKSTGQLPPLAPPGGEVSVEKLPPLEFSPSKGSLDKTETASSHPDKERLSLHEEHEKDHDSLRGREPQKTSPMRAKQGDPSLEEFSDDMEDTVEGAVAPGKKAPLKEKPSAGRDPLDDLQLDEEELVAEEASKAALFQWPVKGKVLQHYGRKGKKRHDGILISSKKQHPVHSIGSGEVIYAGNEIADLGYVVLLQHPNGFISAYGHLNKPDVKAGARVKAGQVIGSVHEKTLYFELRKGKKTVNPLDYLE